MRSLLEHLRGWLTAATLFAVSPIAGVDAAGSKISDPSRPATTTRAVTTTDGGNPVAEPSRRGSPEMGILIVIGIVGFVVFIAWLVAWLVAQIGDDSHSSGDSSLV